MKNYLAVDTSGDFLAAVAKKEGEIFQTFLGDCAMKHSVTLMNEVDELLSRAGLALLECDFFAAVVGAGSFTGIRIGISAIKGLALALKKPTLAITSFDTLAYNGVGGKVENEKKLLCLVDALHDSYYACGYQNGEVALPPAYLTEEEVLALSEKGYTLRAGKELEIAKKAEVEIVSPVDGLKNAVEILSERKAFGELAALYVRKSSAELNLKKDE